MGIFSIIHANIITPFEVIQDGTVIIREGKIDFVGTYDPSHKKNEQSVIDGKGLTLIPGLVDLQINGAKGIYFSKIVYEDQNLNLAIKEIIKTGTTSFLATLISSPIEDMEASIRALSNLKQEKTEEIIKGLHLEGPFLNPQCSGAHNKSDILEPSIEILKSILGWTDGTVKLVTLAPEMPGADKLINHLKKNGIVVSIGHSQATPQECIKAIDQGASCFTHLFNAMGPIHQRAPGPSVAGLVEDRAYVTVIGDGIHVAPSILKLIARSKDPDHLILVSDLSPLAGLKEGVVYPFAGGEGLVRDGVCRILKNGKEAGFAGSVKSLFEGMISFMEASDWSIGEVVRTVTINPARLLGLDAHIGSIEQGKDADLVLFDKDYRVRWVFKEGDSKFVG